ncbi:MAG TPA: hypothetical protein DCP20_09030 [Coriobacteriia bacterium]|nr:MAG: N-acetylmuramoyl-L-alanine amidase [Actinobacteria bacterium 66_15]HAL30840.1 hypothetical protein [Coriobacteriia bacterium]
MRLTHTRRVVLCCVTVVMLLGGSASGLVVIMPTVDWTQVIVSGSGTAAEDTAALDGHLLAYEYESGIRVRNLATGVTRTIPSTGGTQAEPDVSGDRVVFQDNSSGNYDIKMYQWSTNTVSTVRATAAVEEFPRIDGNFVIWWDDTNEDLWGRNYDMGGLTATQLSNGYPDVDFDVDNGLCVLLVRSTDHANLYHRTLSPLSDWSGPFAIGDYVANIEMHGRRVALETDDGAGDTDIVVYDFNTGAVENVATSDTLDEHAPTIFDRSVAWHEAEGTAFADIGYQLIAGLYLVQTPSFGGAESDRYPSLYGHRIGYQRSDGGDQDVMLATSDMKLRNRTSGTDRYATAAAVSTRYFTDATDVVLCNGLNFPDALCAAPLARALGAPLLLTAPNSIPSATLAEITRLNPTKVWIIGGSSVVSDAVMTQLDASYAVERIWGDNRYETSAEVARRLGTILGAGEMDRACFATGENFPDALAVGPVAGAANAPIMLVQKDSVPGSVADAVDDLDITIGYIVGGESVVSAGTNTALRTLIIANGAIGTITERWWGDNRYETATAVAEKGLAYRWIDLDTCGFATGTNFPDALGGGAALGVYGSALLLTDGSTLSADTGAFLDAHRYQIGRTDCFGGSDVLSATVYDAIAAKIY